MTRKYTYETSKKNIMKVKEQQLLFTVDDLLPETLPHEQELHASFNLSSIFDECHNYIYANEGLLKDKIFHEIVKLLAMKLYDELTASKQNLQFGITSSEYRSIISNKHSDFENRMNKLFDKVKKKYASFISDSSIKLNPLTLAFVVGRLQYVSLLSTPGDIKGQAFQSFVYKNQRGDRGEFFTPHPIVKLAVEMIDPKINEYVIDPACGSGGFLIQTILYVTQKYINLSKSDYIKKHIRGIEFNPDVALSAMIRLAFEGGSGNEINCSNALLDDEKLNNKFDIVLTNPPFGSKGKVEDQKILKSYILARRWNKKSNLEWEETTNVLSGQSPEVLFIEKSLRLLRPGGRMAIVLPDGVLQNISNNYIRFWMRCQAKVLAVISIPQEAFVPFGTGIKTSLIILQKLPSSATTVFMAKMCKLGYDVKGQPVYKRDITGKILNATSSRFIVDDDVNEIASAYMNFLESKFKSSNEFTYAIPEEQLNNRLDVEHYKPEDRMLLERLISVRAKPICELADILRETDDFRLASNDEIRYIAISDVDARTMQVVNQQVIKPHEAPSRATYRVLQGDIITAISGASTGTTNQATALITFEEDGAICSNGFAVIRNIQGIEPLFLLAYMRTQYYLRQVRRLMTGHAIPAISIDDLARVLVPIPPVEVQKRVAIEISNVLLKRREATKAGESIVGETEFLIDKMTL